MSSIKDLMHLDDVIAPCQLEEMAALESDFLFRKENIQQLAIRNMHVLQKTQIPQSNTVHQAIDAPAKQTHKKRGRRFFTVLASCALVLSLGTAAIATFSTDTRLLQALHADSQSQIAQLNAMNTQLHVTAHADGYTVTLREAISDRHNTWMLLEVEGPEDTVLDENLVLFDTVRVQMEKMSSHGYTIYTLPDENQNDNRLTMILDFSARNQLAGQRLTLEFEHLISNIVDAEQQIIGVNHLADGPWKFELHVPKKDSTVSMWQWKTLTIGEKDFLLTKIEVSPLSITLNATKINHIAYLQLKNSELHVWLKDGTELEVERSGSGSNHVQMQYQYTFPYPVQLDQIDRIVFCGHELNW